MGGYNSSNELVLAAQTYRQSGQNEFVPGPANSGSVNEKFNNVWVITKEMIDYKRPGTGLPPEAVSYIVGKKAVRNISYDEIINLTDF